MTVSAVDLAGGQLRVSAQLQALPGQPLGLRPPKTHCSVRTVPLPDTVAAAIFEQLRRWPTTVGQDGQDDLLVRTVTARPVWPRTFHSRIWRTATTGAGLPGVRFHQLRHFYASALIRAGESVKIVPAALGHASAVEILQIYVGLWPDSDQRTRAAIDGLGIGQPPSAGGSTSSAATGPGANNAGLDLGGRSGSDTQHRQARTCVPERVPERAA